MSSALTTNGAGPAGWVRLRPSPLLLAFGLLCIPFAVFFTALPVFAFYADNFGSRIGFLTLAPPLAVLTWLGIYGVFIVRTRFNSAGVEYRGLTRRVMIPWTEVREIKARGAFGSVVMTARGQLVVWRNFHGFPQLLAEAARHAVEIDPTLTGDLTEAGRE